MPLSGEKNLYIVHKSNPLSLDDYATFKELLPKHRRSLLKDFRMVDPSGGDWCLTVWQTRSNAESFLSDLTQYTRSPNWITDEVPENDGRIKKTPFTCLHVGFHKEENGDLVYRLIGEGWHIIRSLYPEAKVALRLTVKTAEQQDNPEGAAIENIPFRITDLSKQEIVAVGGLEIVESASGRILQRT